MRPRELYSFFSLKEETQLGKIALLQHGKKKIKISFPTTLMCVCGMKYFLTWVKVCFLFKAFAMDLCSRMGLGGAPDIVL